MGTMKDDDGDPLATYPSRLSPARSSRSYGSYETGEASTSTGVKGTSTDSTTLAQSHHTDVDEPIPNPHAPDQGYKDLSHEAHRRRRSHKPRSSGGFLLPNPLLDEPSKAISARRDDGRRRSRIPVDNHKGKGLLDVPGKPNSTGFSQTGLGIDDQETRRSSDGQTRRVLSPAPDEDRTRSQGRRETSRIPSPRPSTAPLDMDSTQIVNMALNLSESRRLAERRNVSSPIPPRLAQLPDSPAGGGLKQHLQQQRRVSRGVSPRPDKTPTPRAVSTSTTSSPFQPSYDDEGGYTYHFSSSTLSRAQKAKDYLELMAQYRRLLQFLPPLKQDGRSRPSSSTASTTAGSNPAAGASQVVLGRPYNPLQYIRNRKVRARERKPIDGEAQGFSDVSRVTRWVDEAAASAATSGAASGTSLPSFPGADQNADPEQRPSNIPRPISIGKNKRFWSIDPADMLADAYWLEQGDNKYLIEDRHYSKIFTQKRDSQVQTPHQPNESVASVLSPSSNKEGNVADVVPTSETDHISPTKVEFEVPPISARDRARQRLLKGKHHKPNSLSHGHDFLRLRKGSLSDTSDSESDRKRRNRNGTISASERDLLEKQMMEMLVKEVNKEQKEKPNLDEADRGHLKQLPSRMATPEKTSQTPELMHSRRGSRVDVMDQLDKVGRGRVLQGSPIGSGRPSLEVPGQSYRLSMELDSSRPESPDRRPRGENNYMPTIGMDLSPPNSRPGSPSRKPFSKVKNIFRDRSKERERGADRVSREKDDRLDSPVEQPELLSPSILNPERTQSPDRRRSKSLTRKIIPRSTNEGHKYHRSVGSIKLKPDEQIGLRSIFRGGAKLDGMIRGGVSKVTDLLWKKDSDGESTSSTSSSEDSDDEPKRGRRIRESITLSRGSSRRLREENRQANYMDVLPPFKSTAASHDKSPSEGTDALALTSTTRPPRSPRFDRLKPPRIDIRKASPPSEFEHTKSHLLRDSDISDAESRSGTNGYKSPSPSKDLGEIFPPTASQPLANRPQISARTMSQGARHWSISNRSSSPQGTRLSRREVARLRALILCSGIKAMEISRRVHEVYPLFAPDNKAAGCLPWTDISQFAPDGQTRLTVPGTQLYPAAARALAANIERSIRASETSTARFTAETAPTLHRRVEALHDRVGGGLAEMTRRAADEADDLGRDLMDGQRLKVKSVTDTMDKMLRRRRRRFRWVRRAGWLAVEWVLVGFMWYVWFVVMLARIVLGVGKGVVGVARWLLWL